MSEQIYTTDDMPYPHYGQKSYRIEIKQSPHGWFQRHIWTRNDGSVCTDEWIPSHSKQPADGFRPVK